MSYLPFGFYGFSIAVLLISIMLSISGILLGIGYALDDKKLKELGKNEIYQSIINGMLVGGLLLLFVKNGPIEGLVNSLIPQNSSFSCPSYMASNMAICFAYSYLAGAAPYTFMGSMHLSLLDEVTLLIGGLFLLSTILGAIASLEINLLIVTLNFSYIMKPLIGEIEHIIGVLTATAVGISVQAFLLMFVAASAISVVLPTGIILRSFYPTRKLGGFFIALSIGLYVIFPLTYLFNAFLLSSYSSSFNASSITASTASASAFESQVVATIGATNSTSIPLSLEHEAISISSSIGALLNSLLSFVSGLVMQVFILPMFSLVVTGISIKEMAELLGSEAFFGKFKVL
ncbi:MAG: hypothetical protein ACP5P2_00325 [Candidatus Micrarchaeia archaeon]